MLNVDAITICIFCLIPLKQTFSLMQEFNPRISQNLLHFYTFTNKDVTKLVHRETSYETELRLEREELQRKKQEEEERRKKLASKAAAFGDVKIGKKPTTAQKQPSKLKIKKIRSKQDVTKSNDSSGSGNLERQTSSVSGGSGGGLERQGSNISNSNVS